MVKVVYPSILCDDTVRKLSAIGIEKMSDYVNEIEAAPDAVKLLFKDKLEMLIDRLYQNKINYTIKRLRSRAKLSDLMPVLNLLCMIIIAISVVMQSLNWQHAVS